MTKYPMPQTPTEWLHEIVPAMADAREAKPYAHMIGYRIAEADLFHLAPVVSLKLRGRKQTGKEAQRVTKTALANYIANSNPEELDHDLEYRPFMAFALCYVASHLALDLLDENEADAILNYCEEHLGDE